MAPNAASICHGTADGLVATEIQPTSTRQAIAVSLSTSTVAVPRSRVPGLVASLQRMHVTPPQAAIISFDYEPLKAIKRALPAYEAYWLVDAPSADPKKKSLPLDTLIRDSRAAGFDGLDFSYKWPLDAGGVKQIKAAGLSLHVWTVDVPLVAKRWSELGADSITTNRAGWLREQLAR